MLNCVWNITAEEGHFIEITFDDFEVEGPRNDVCTFDYVSIQQGKGPFTPSVSVNDAVSLWLNCLSP